MSDSSLKKIEKVVERIARQQEEIQSRLDGLEERIARPASATRDEVTAFLDKFGAGEAFGEEIFGAWIAVCDTDCLRGGLRTIQMREGMHARLLHERVKELGGTPSCEYDDDLRDAGMKMMGSRDLSDAQKLATFVAQFPDADTALAELLDLRARLTDDLETQSLLETIEQDERSTLAFLKQVCEALNA